MGWPTAAVLDACTCSSAASSCCCCNVAPVLGTSATSVLLTPRSGMFAAVPAPLAAGASSPVPQGAGLGAAATAATAPASPAEGDRPPAAGSAIGTAAPFVAGRAIPADGAVRSPLLLGPPGRCGEFWTATRPMLSRCATSGLPNQPSTCSYSRECLPCKCSRKHYTITWLSVCVSGAEQAIQQKQQCATGSGLD